MSTLEYLASSPSDSVATKLENRTARIGVIGLGYVGLPLVLLFSEQDFCVTGFDIDAKKVVIFHAGGSYIVRIPETEIQAAKQQRLYARPPITRRSPDMDAIIICVPTPLDDHHEPDLSFIDATAEVDCASSAPRTAGSAGKHDVSGHHGRAADPDPGKESAGAESRPRRRRTANTFYVAFSPEREDPGNDTVARCDIPKVVGGLNPTATELGRQMYGTIFTSHGSGLNSRGGGDDQAAGKHLSLREHCAGERTQTALLCAWASTFGK